MSNLGFFMTVTLLFLQKTITGILSYGCRTPIPSIRLCVPYPLIWWRN